RAASAVAAPAVAPLAARCPAGARARAGVGGARWGGAAGPRRGRSHDGHAARRDRLLRPGRVPREVVRLLFAAGAVAEPDLVRSRRRAPEREDVLVAVPGAARAAFLLLEPAESFRAEP